MEAKRIKCNYNKKKNIKKTSYLANSKRIKKDIKLFK